MRAKYTYAYIEGFSGYRVFVVRFSKESVLNNIKNHLLTEWYSPPSQYHHPGSALTVVVTGNCLPKEVPIHFSP